MDTEQVSETSIFQLFLTRLIVRGNSSAFIARKDSNLIHDVGLLSHLHNIYKPVYTNIHRFRLEFSYTVLCTL